MMSGSKANREPRLWLLRCGGIKVADETGATITLQLTPVEMRRLAQKLRLLADDLSSPSRIGADFVDEEGR